ncbi:MAG: alpha/beta hydrolase [Gammaproteobacteria bacterium]|nr:alpha/beta hydrolase [Gammaproteobacteria bacterium]
MSEAKIREESIHLQHNTSIPERYIYTKIYEQEINNPTIMLIAGLGDSCDIWQEYALKLSQNSYNVIIFDNRDVGRSTYTPYPYSITDMAIDALAILNHFNLPVVHLVGHSMGAVIAQELARIQPEKILSMTLIAGIASPPIEQSSATEVTSWTDECVKNSQVNDLEPSDIFIDRITNILRQSAFSEVFYLQQADFFRDYLTLLSQSPYRQKTSGLVRQFNAISHFKFSENTLFYQPTLIIGGEQDPVFPPDRLRKGATQFQNVTLEIIPQVKHCLHLEKIDYCIDRIIQFIGKSQ